MYCKLIIVKYPRWMGWAGVLSMALFRIAFFCHSSSFYKLMGSGRNGSFDKMPDWRQWAVFAVYNEPLFTATERQELQELPRFVRVYLHFFRVTTTTFVLEALEGHGWWDGKEIFGPLPKNTDYEGMIAVLTRATIRPGRLANFWKHVGAVSARMQEAEGFLLSYGIGEVPWVRQATFSLWQSKAQMKHFAYRLPEHADVIRKTRQEKWYSEDLFVRFRVHRVFGKVAARLPIAAR